LAQLVEELLDFKLGQAVGMGHNGIKQLAPLGEGEDKIKELLDVRKGGKEGRREGGR